MICVKFSPTTCTVEGETFETCMALAALDELIAAAQGYVNGTLTMEQTSAVRKRVMKHMLRLAQRENAETARMFRKHFRDSEDDE